MLHDYFYFIFGDLSIIIGELDIIYLVESLFYRYFMAKNDFKEVYEKTRRTKSEMDMTLLCSQEKVVDTKEDGDNGHCWGPHGQRCGPSRGYEESQD